MGSCNGKITIIGFLVTLRKLIIKHPKCFLILIFFVVMGCLPLRTVHAGTLKLVDTPFTQVIELYSKATGKNVFLDETVQKNRKVNVFLQGMNIAKAFDIIKKTMGLESYEVGTGTILIFPPEKAQRYRPELKPCVLKTPEGLDSKWVAGLLNGVIPSVKTTLPLKDDKSIVLFGPDAQIDDAKELARKLPAVATKRMELDMSENEAKLAVREIKMEGIEVEATSSGIAWIGSPNLAESFLSNLIKWREKIQWGKVVFTPENLDHQKIMKAAEATKGRAVITDLGGSGSFLIEGPEKERNRICEILDAIDRNAKLQRKEISLGEIKPEAVKEAVKVGGLEVESLGDQRMVLIGRPKALKNAADVIQTLGKKRQQVMISLMLVEISRSRSKALGINLDKNSYSYGEIKEFHGKDQLPLLLKALDEGKDGRILAKPNLRVLEGEEARVTIGDRIPLEVAATAQTDSGSTLRLNTQLSWVDVGIKMTVKNLSVNPDLSIRMALKGEVSSVVSLTSQGYPQIRTREAESMLRVEDGGTVIMGGLFNKENLSTNDRIPILSHIPLLGGLARSRDRQNSGTEILIVVTAKITKE
ncbi:MAG: hypothetical protein HQM08_22350 [Candidatus Riflebacteria bacterium]|nr:hypothetical protein [Candidatus Riflebacteria bacterium]